MKPIKNGLKDLFGLSFYQPKLQFKASELMLFLIKFDTNFVTWGRRQSPNILFNLLTMQS